MNRIVLPGATIGVLGSGQLGRMFALAARRMGYRVHTLSPGVDTPTGQVADLEVSAEYDDLDAIRAFARGVDVVTFEFENVSTDAADAAAEIVPVRPSGAALHITQQRAREKAFLADRGYPGDAVCEGAVARRAGRRPRRVGLPAIVKTAAFGYDGKGQHRIDRIEDGERVWGLIGHQEAIIERVVDFTHEISVVAARGLDGAVRALRRDREHASQSHPRPVGGAGARAARHRRRGRAPRASRARRARLRRRAVRRVLRHRATAGCSSTRSRRGRTTPATSRSTRA